MKTTKKKNIIWLYFFGTLCERAGHQLVQYTNVYRDGHETEGMLCKECGEEFPNSSPR